jgi:hypothetical protein
LVVEVVILKRQRLTVAEKTINLSFFFIISQYSSTSAEDACDNDLCR